MCAVHAKSLQSQSTLCDSMDCKLSGPSVLGILQARILKWVAMPSSRGSSQPRVQTCLKSPALAGRFFTTSAAWEAPSMHRGSTKYQVWIKHSVLLKITNTTYCLKFLYLCECVFLSLGSYTSRNRLAWSYGNPEELPDSFQTDCPSGSSLVVQWFRLPSHGLGNKDPPCCAVKPKNQVTAPFYIPTSL